MKLNVKIYHYKPGTEPHYDTFPVEVPETANVLDAIERAWDDFDRTIMFRHACHHASCGSCGLRVNDQEKLPCVTPCSLAQAAPTKKGRPGKTARCLVPDPALNVSAPLVPKPVGARATARQGPGPI